MATLIEATLDPVERRALDRLVELLEAEYGPNLLGVWLYGSRARGERTAASGASSTRPSWRASA